MWELDYKESWALKNWCFWTVVLEKTLESPLDCKEIQPVHPKGNRSWVFIGRTDGEAETPILWPPNVTHLKRPWCQEKLKAGGEEDDRGWDGWMASLTQWTWVSVNSGSWWLTGRPGVLRFMGSQRDTTEPLNWTDTHMYNTMYKHSKAHTPKTMMDAESQSRLLLFGIFVPLSPFWEKLTALYIGRKGPMKQNYHQ